MLLRAKIRCGEEDLSVFESQILEDNSLQRAHSSPTLQDSSQASQVTQASHASHASHTSHTSQASSTKDGANSKATSKRTEGQRHSYRQAVKK